MRSSLHTFLAQSESYIRDSHPLVTPEVIPEETNSIYLKRSAILYEIYPLSFYESSDRKKGIGNIKGVIEKLPYLKDLGVTMLWFTPLYPSPWEDGGYDVSDYMKVNEEFGTLDDFRELVAKAQGLGIDIMMDITLNHGSTEHALFQQAVSSPEDPAQLYFIFREPKPDGSPPTNQASIFDGTPGSAWTYIPEIRKYYFHKFTVGQPDWNLWNPQVRSMFQDVLRFWSEMGVKGFRFDVLHLTYEQLTDFSEINPNYDESQNAKIDQWNWYAKYCLHPEVEQLIKHTIVPLLEAYGLIGVGEINSNDNALLEMVRKAGMYPFNFTLLEETQTSDTFTAQNIKEKVERSIATLGGARALMMAYGNHDNLRCVDRIGLENTRLLTLLSLTLGGMAVIYNGDELGMPNGIVPTDKIRDPQYLNGANPVNRDVSRIPINWRAEDPNGGFSLADENATYLPALPLSLRRGWSAIEQLSNPDSMLHMVKALIHLREEYNDVLVRGDYISLPLIEGHENVFCFIKQGQRNPTHQVFISLNMSDKEQDIEIPKGSVLFTTHSHTAQSINNGKYHLRPYEGIIIEIAA